MRALVLLGSTASFLVHVAFADDCPTGLTCGSSACCVDSTGGRDRYYCCGRMVESDNSERVVIGFNSDWRTQAGVLVGCVVASIVLSVILSLIGCLCCPCCWWYQYRNRRHRDGRGGVIYDDIFPVGMVYLSPYPPAASAEAPPVYSSPMGRGNGNDYHNDGSTSSVDSGGTKRSVHFQDETRPKTLLRNGNQNNNLYRPLTPPHQ